MATVTRENIGLLHDKITVTVTPSDYTASYKKSLRKVAETASIPGFRKGKVPESVVNKIYGEKIIYDEVYKTADKGLKDFMQKEQINFFFQPLPVSSNLDKVDINNLKEYEFIFEIGLRPEININPADIKVTRYVIDIPETMIDHESERIQSELGTLVELETISSDDDLLNIIFAETDAQGQLIDGGLEKATSLNLKHFSPSFRSSLLELKVDGFVDAALDIAFEEKERVPVLEELGLDTEDASSATKTFRITITKISLLQKAALTEDFFEKAYPGREIKTEQAFRDVVRSEIAKYFAEQSRKQMHDQIYHYLLDHTEIELPKEFLLKMLKETDEKHRTEEEIKEIYPSFESQSKWSMISGHLQTTENVIVTQEDLKQAARQQLFQYLGGQAQLLGDDNKFIDDYAERMVKDEKFVQEQYYNILANKIFTSLEDKVTATEESIDVETFGSKLHHHHY